jgi:hypothetical protein
MDTQALQDDELIALAREWRQRALRGDKSARGMAHKLECEARRRFPETDKSALRPLPEIPLLGVLQQTHQRRWVLW